MDSTKIMIVEDEFIIAEDIKDVLTKLGYKISAIAFSGEQALKELEVQLPDLVLMDVMLRGDLDGIDTANQIIQKYKLPVIFLTANTDQATLQRVKSSEAYGYILKPFEQKELYTNIELALYKSRTEKEIIKKHETLQMIADFDETISHLSLNDIVANTFKFIRDRMQIIHSTIIIYDQYRDDYKRFVSDIKEFANQDVIDKGDYKMISKIFFDKVVKSEKTILIKDISAENNIEEKPLNDYLITRGMKSYCTIKLFDKDVFLGCITIFKKEADAISSDTVQILELLSHRLSLSIQNSNLFEDLLESENKFRNFADSLPQIVAEIDFNHRINYANHNALQVFGYGKEDLEKGVFVYDMIRDVDREKYFKSVEDLVNGNGVQGLEFNAQKKDGTIFPVLVYSNIIFRKNIPIGILAILIDISQQKLIEEERIKIKKLESIGILAGGIAHDFNNILTAILGNVSLAKIYTEPDDKVYEILNEAEKACIHSKDLTQQLLTFSKGGLPVKKIGSIKDLITESVQFLLRGSNVKANFKFDEGLHNIEMDEGQINQVINNLTINAIQAMPDGGYINIDCKNIFLETNNIKNIKMGDYVKIEIRDQGIGISKEHISKIFDPYFTTKQKGSGLGLAVTYSIIMKHNGYIEVDSELGKGTTFNIYFPASLEKNEKNERNSVGNFNKQKYSGKVLVMDDEELIRDVSFKMLRKFGFEADVAEDGEKAIEMYKKAFLEKKPYDVVVMDLTIPAGMGGKDAIKYLMEIDPNVKAIVTSGYSTDIVMNNYKEYGFKAIVVKPYRVEDFITILDKIISSQ